MPQRRLGVWLRETMDRVRDAVAPVEVLPSRAARLHRFAGRRAIPEQRQVVAALDVEADEAVGTRVEIDGQPVA